jgi:hypothetical protein
MRRAHHFSQRRHLQGGIRRSGEQEIAGRVEADGIDNVIVNLVVLQQFVGSNVPDLEETGA